MTDSAHRTGAAFRLGLVLLIAAALCCAAAAARADTVRVNGKALSRNTLAALQKVYGRIPAGRYWYDPYSGFWGVRGGPSIGRILPGLRLGGPLRPSASGGGNGRLTGVFINGREIHPQEYMILVRLFGTVYPGRYWLGPNLVGGYEGRPPSFDLRRAAAAAGGRGGGGGGYNRSTLFGGLMSDGKCSGYLHPGGTTVMTGNC